MNLGQILDQALNYQNTTKETADSMTVAFLLGVVNELQDRALSQAEPNWAVRVWKFRCVPSYSTGTISVTQGLTSVTGHLTVWDSSFIGRKLRLGAGPEWYEVVGVGQLPLGDVTSDQAIQIEPQYSGASATSTYAVYQDEYDLPGDFRAMMSCRDETRPYILRYEDPWSQDHRIPRLFWASAGGNVPWVYSINKRDRSPMLNQWTGTVTLTQFSNVMTAVGVTPGPLATSTFFAVDDVRCHGAYIRMSGSTTFVQVRRVTDSSASASLETTAFQLYEPWRGPTTSVVGWEIVPKGQWKISLWPVIESARTIECRYYHQPEPLINYEDVPIIPREHHDYLWMGAAYRLSELSGSEVSEGQRNALRADWLEAERRMLRNMSPSRDQIIQRRQYGSWPWPRLGVPRRTVFDGPSYPGNYPMEWSS